MTLTSSRSRRGLASARPRSGARDLLAALPWIGPATLLIALIVLFPAGLLFWNSTRDISRSGIDKGGVGFDNFAFLFANPSLPGVLLRTVIWVVVVVAVTVLLSLALAQLLSKAFPGRRLVRMIVIVPWAASVVMTTMVVYYGLEPYVGIFNTFFVDIGLIAEPYGWTKNAFSAFSWSMAIAVFVSLPFTTYTILSGLQTVPGEIVEAARMDGAGPVRTYFSVILPQLRSALAVCVLINIINVFNNLPILRVMTGSIPGNDADTVMTLIFKYIGAGRHDVAAALSVLGFLLVLVVVAIYVKTVKPLEGER